MRKALTITLVAALALFAGSAAYANYCARDVVPASTLLVPYAVQDMTGQYAADMNNYTTILTVTNVSKDAQIIHITVWNAVSTACLDFNEVLSGYDVWQIYTRDMINGNFGAFDTVIQAHPTGNYQPFEWGPDGRSAYSATVPTGVLPYPNATNTLTSTNCYMPYGNGLTLNNNIDCLRSPLYTRVHSGCNNLKVRADFNNDWLHFIGADTKTTNPIWFYMTVDVVNVCNFAFPDQDGYFNATQQNGGQAYYKHANVLIGDINYLAAAQNFSESLSAVHIESDLDTYGPTDGVNFYDPKATAETFLEPLATAVAFNYYNMPQYSIATNVMLWKNFQDFHPNGTIDDCGYYIYYNWDQDEHTNSRSGSCTVSPCNPNDIDPNEFPFETQSVGLTKQPTGNFDLVAQAGWMLIVLPPSYPSAWLDPTAGTNEHVYTSDTGKMMMWAATKITYGTYSTSTDAATMANAHCFAGQILPQLGINYIYN